MAGERKYTRIPPESTGDRVYMIHTAEVNYDAKDISHVWKIGQRYTITGGSGQTFLVHVHGTYESTTTTGRLSVHFAESARESGYVVLNDQSIQYDSGAGLVTIATVSADSYDIYIPAQNIMGFDNPEYGWNIDRFGSGQVTFEEGTPQLTGMGNLKINDAKLLSAYDFSKSNLPNEFVNSREGGSAVTTAWDPDTRSVKLSIGTTAADRVTHTSNLFHSYQEGSSLLFVMGVRVGDLGTENVARLWGSFDAECGFFFQVKGSDAAPGGRAAGGSSPSPGTVGSALRIVHRFNFSGTVTNHETLQHEWNKDTLLGDGELGNPSGMKLAINKINAYWIDYQFLGGGRTRWGVFFNGQRIVVHELFHGNGEAGTMTQNSNPIDNPNRPVCWATANYGTSGTPTVLHAHGASVFIEAATDPLKAAQQISVDVQTKTWGQPELQPYWRTKQTRNGKVGAEGFPTYLKSGTYSSGTATQYHHTLSPIQFLQNGDENHSVYQPLIFDIANRTIHDEAKSPVEIRAFYKCVIRGLEFGNTSVSSPTVAVDEEGDHLRHRVQIGRFRVDGEGEFDFKDISDNFQYGTVRNTSDQLFARELQPLVSWTSSDDKYSVGTSRVLIEVGADPIYGLTSHYFGDKQPVVIREVDGDQDMVAAFNGTGATTFTNLKTVGGVGYASVDVTTNPNDWHYLSYVTSSQGRLYSSIADIDDDRLTRKVDVDDCVSLQPGQKLTVTAGGETAFVMKIDVTGDGDVLATAATTVEYQIKTVGTSDFTLIGATVNAPGEIFTATGVTPGTGTLKATNGNPGNIAIVGRSHATASYTGAFTTDGGGAGTLSGATTDSGLAKDYWTSLTALSFTDLGINADADLGTGKLALYASPDPRAQWTFMDKHTDESLEDTDGDAGPKKRNARTTWNIFWRERTQ